MTNEFHKLAMAIVSERAAIEHKAKCANPDNCSDWHIRSDYMPQVRKEVIYEMREALVNLEKLTRRA